MKVVLVFSILLLGGVHCQDGFEPHWFVPDIATPKPDPYNMIAGDYGQPEGRFNWNEDQFELLGRPQKTCNGCTEGGKHVAIEDFTMFVNDKEFFIKAVAYNPVPLGIRDMKVNGEDGGGLCSQRRTPYGKEDYISACIDSDYFDGSLSDPTRVPPPPANGWFTDVWARDFELIRASGANTVRIYNVNPTTKMYTAAVLAGEQTAISGIIVDPFGKDHLPFLDAAEKAGLKVIFPLFADETIMETLPEVEYKRFLNNMIDEVGNHSAILMYTVGNEMEILDDNALLNKVNMYIEYSREYQLSKWGRKIPITHALIDIPNSYARMYEVLKVDVFTTNAGYRGEGFSALWNQIGALSRQYNIPNFIGEMGWHQVNGRDTANRPGWFNKQWKDLIEKGGPNACIGGCFFEYSDEIYSKDAEDQKTMGMVSMRVSSPSDMPPKWSTPTSSFATTSAVTSSTTSEATTSVDSTSSSTQALTSSTSVPKDQETTSSSSDPVISVEDTTQETEKPRKTEWIGTNGQNQQADSYADQLVPWICFWLLLLLSQHY